MLSVIHRFPGSSNTPVTFILSVHLCEWKNIFFKNNNISRSYHCHTAEKPLLHMLKILNRSVLNVFLSRVLQQQFVPAVLKLPPICKDPKIASQLCVPAGISLRDSVRSACGMQRQALRLWLDAYHYHILLLADGMTFTLSAWDAIAGRGGSDGTFPDAFFTPLGSLSRPRAKKSHF